MCVGSWVSLTGKPKRFLKPFSSVAISSGSKAKPPMVRFALSLGRLKQRQVLRAGAGGPSAPGDDQHPDHAGHTLCL